MRKTKLNFASEEERRAYLKAIIAFFHDERSEEIGIVGAEKVLEFFFQTFGEEIYQKAIRDVRNVLKERADSLEVELDLLSEG